MPTTDIQELVGRTRELGLVDAHLEAVRAAEGTTLVLSGEPGSGKTSVLHAARRRAGDAFTVIACRGVEWEAELPFSALHELLGPLLGELSALPDPQRDALSSALGLTPAVDVPALHLYAGALSLLIEATRQAPVLVIVDDLQWVDGGTRQVLAFIARRLARERLGLLMATRPGPALAGLPREAEPLAPLDRLAVAELAARHLGRSLPDAAVADLTDASGGNPLAVVESVGHVGEDLWLRGSEIDQPLPVGDLIERGFADRLGSLSADARAAVEAVAAGLRDDATTVGAVLDRLGIDRAALQEAERAHILTLADARVQFAHPLLRSLAHRRTAPDALRRCHAAFAHATTDDAGLHAWHAASAVTEVDDAIADELDTAADGFRRRGGLRAAAQALARAAALSSEPRVRADRLGRAGSAAQFAGSREWALRLMDEAFEASVDPVSRAHAEFRRTKLSCHVVEHQDTLARFRVAFDMAVDVDDDLAAQVASLLAYEGVIAGDRGAVDEAVGHLQRLVDVAEPSPSTDELVATIQVYVALLMDSEAEPSTTVSVITAMLEAEESGAEADPIVETLIWIEMYDEAIERIGAMARRSRARGDAFTLSVALGFDGMLRFKLGEWALACAQLEEAVRIAESTGLTAQASQPAAMLAIVRAARGDEGLVDDLPAIESLGARFGMAVNTEFTEAARGLMHLGAGRGAAAADHFERARAWKRAAGQVEPCGSCWPADLVDAQILAGDLERAGERLDELRAYADRSGRRWALAAVARLEAQLAPDDVYEAHFLEAFDRYAVASDPFGEARARLAYGQRLRRARRRLDAREQLTAALTTFDRLGAGPWSAQARRELEASGETLRRGDKADPHALTPQEAQIAELVAGGASNKEVAGTLFLSPKTVETHLSRIYRKLGISSRTQLAVKLR